MKMRTRLSNAIKYAIPARVRLQMYHAARRRRWWAIASWLLLDRRALSAEEIALGQHLWSAIQAVDKSLDMSRARSDSP